MSNMDARSSEEESSDASKVEQHSSETKSYKKILRGVKIGSWIIWWLLVYAGSIAVLGWAIYQKRFVPNKRNEAEDIVGQNFTVRKSYIGLIFHIVGGSIGLFSGPIQFQPFIRRKSLTSHKVNGYIYFLGMTMSLFGAVWTIIFCSGGMVAKFAFSLLAFGWLLCNSMGFYYIKLCKRLVREQCIQIHREWMIRSYSLTMSAVTLRIYLPLLVLFNAYALKREFADAFLSAYMTVSWLCWVPNIILAELYIRFVYYSPEISKQEETTEEKLAITS